MRLVFAITGHTTIPAVDASFQPVVLKELRRKLCDIKGPEPLKSWEDLMLGLLIRDGMIVEARGGLVNKVARNRCL